MRNVFKFPIKGIYLLFKFPIKGIYLLFKFPIKGIYLLFKFPFTKRGNIPVDFNELVWSLKCAQDELARVDQRRLHLIRDISASVFTYVFNYRGIKKIEFIRLKKFLGELILKKFMKDNSLSVLVHILGVTNAIFKINLAPPNKNIRFTKKKLSGLLNKIESFDFSQPLFSKNGDTDYKFSSEETFTLSFKDKSRFVSIFKFFLTHLSLINMTEDFEPLSPSIDTEIKNGDLPLFQKVASHIKSKETLVSVIEECKKLIEIENKFEINLEMIKAAAFYYKKDSKLFDSIFLKFKDEKSGESKLDFISNPPSFVSDEFWGEDQEFVRENKFRDLYRGKLSEDLFDDLINEAEEIEDPF